MDSENTDSNENGLKASIEHKLLKRPQYHDRFQMLNDQEVIYLRQNAGFSKKEEMVFLMRCKGLNLISIAFESNYSLSQIKKISARVNNKIRWILLV